MAMENNSEMTTLCDRNTEQINARTIICVYNWCKNTTQNNDMLKQNEGKINSYKSLRQLHKYMFFFFFSDIATNKPN